MATGRIDYPTLLGYINALGIKVYNTNHIDCKFSNDEELGCGASMRVYRGHLDQGSNAPPIPVALKVPQISGKVSDAKIFNILAEVRQEIRMMKNFEAHPFIIS